MQYSFEKLVRLFEKSHCRPSMRAFFLHGLLIVSLRPAPTVDAELPGGVELGACAAGSSSPVRRAAFCLRFVVRLAPCLSGSRHPFCTDFADGAGQ